MESELRNQAGPMIGTPEAARLIGCAAKHVRALCMRGEIEAVRLGKCWHVNRAALLDRLGLTDGEAMPSE